MKKSPLNLLDVLEKSKSKPDILKVVIQQKEACGAILSPQYEFCTPRGEGTIMDDWMKRNLVSPSLMRGLKGKSDINSFLLIVVPLGEYDPSKKPKVKP